MKYIVNLFIQQMVLAGFAFFIVMMIFGLLYAIGIIITIIAM